jgi:hypothetical protein
MTKFIVKTFNQMAHDVKGLFEIVVDDDNIYITKGEAETYPCVVAHTDTVHDIVPWFEIFESGNVMFAMNMATVTQTGIGGDDKVGVFIALEMLRKHDVIKVAFFRDEEHGCLGSRDAQMSFFEDVEFVLQCDRQGYKDFVSNIYGNTLYDDKFRKKIKPILEEYGKVETVHGGITDVGQLVDNGLDVCVANISCGYYAPHTDEEYIDTEDVKNTMDFVNDLIHVLKGEVWKNSMFRHPYSKDKKAYSRHFDGWGFDPYDDDIDDDYYFPERGTKGKVKIYDSLDEYVDSMSSEAGMPDYLRKRRQDLTEDDFDDLETLCSWCNGHEVMFDVNEDADWCFDCQQYTTYYNHFDPTIYDDEADLARAVAAEDLAELLDDTDEENPDLSRIKKLH